MERKKEFYILFSDGGARGNPGPAGIGWILFDGEAQVVALESKYLGETTNNIAEYEALLDGLSYVEKLNSQAKRAKNKKISKIICHLDSELVVKQLSGEYKVKNSDLKDRYIEVKELILNLEEVKFKHVRREKNKLADKLVNISLDAYLNEKN
jgi:ribonuclease HI